MDVRRFRLLAVFACAVFCFATVAAAQEEAPASAAVVLSKPLPPVTAQAGPLTIPVSVTDAAGHPILGLGVGDFTVLDNGQPVAVSGFRAPSPEHPAEVIILLDSVNQRYQSISYVQQQVIAYLRANGGKLGQPTSIQILTDKGLKEIAPSTTDGNALATQLSSTSSPLRAIGRSAGYYGAEDRLGISLHGISDLAVHAMATRNQTLVIWMSPGWPLLDTPGQFYSKKDQQQIFDSIVSLTTLLQRAHITLYSINVHGAGDSADLRNTLYQSFLKPVAFTNQTQFANLGLQVLAVHSGGLAILPSNDLKSGVAECASDATTAYAVQIPTQAGLERPTFHKLEVRVNHADTRKRTAVGYYALPPPR